MKLWPFSRNKDQSPDLPQEVQDYYQAEKREKVGVAGLLALGTLVVTILLAIGLFFGGRWVYRTVFDNDNDQQVAQQDNDQQEESQEAQEEENRQEESADEEEPAPAPSTTQNTPAPNPSAPSTPATPAPAANPSPSNRSSGLPSTGPEDNLAIFLGTVLVASTLFYLTRQPE